MHCRLRSVITAGLDGIKSLISIMKAFTAHFIRKEFKKSK